jgi:hypothetical protein
MRSAFANGSGPQQHGLDKTERTSWDLKKRAARARARMTNCKILLFGLTLSVFPFGVIPCSIALEVLFRMMRIHA